MPQHLRARQHCCQQAGTASAIPARENIVKRFTASTTLAAGLFATLLGASGVAHADWEDTQANPGRYSHERYPMGSTLPPRPSVFLDGVQSRTVIVHHR